MADIELVIKIPEGLKKEFESEQWTALSCMEMKEALIHGTQLPKGHGLVTMNRNIPKFYVCDEMQKLRDGLTERGIEWKDETRKDPAYWLCRTHYKYNKNKWSVVHGFGSYGGFSHSSKDAALLECMCGGNEPVGWLTAEDVFKIMEVNE